MKLNSSGVDPNREPRIMRGKDRVVSIMMRLVLFLLGCVSLQSLADNPVKKIGEIGHGPITEVSGIVKSRTYGDTYWIHNDSGDTPRLFAINADGTVIVPPFVRKQTIGPGHSDQHWPGMPVLVAANQDWEDIAVSGDLIYIADLGNNGNARRDLGLYVVREPNPAAITNVRTFQYYPVEYPEQSSFPAKNWHFDSEGLFVDAAVPYVITKHRQPGKISDWQRGANLYRLDTWHTDQVNQLVKVSTHSEMAVATAADLSPDGQWLAVLCYTDIWLFKRPTKGDDWFASESHRLKLDFRQTGQVEAIAWQDDEQLLITNEPGELFTVSKQTIQQQSP